MRRQLSCLTVLLIASVCGCVPSFPLAEGEIGSMWQLRGDVTKQTLLAQPTFGQQQLPARWIIKQRPSVILSTVSIIRAYDRVKEGTETIEFAISPTHTETLVDLIEDARRILKSIGELAEAASGADRRLWAKKMAEVLAQVEGIARMVSLEEDGEGLGRAVDPTGFAAGPLLEMLAVYLNEHSDGNLLADLKPGDLDRVRSILTQMALRLGFDLAGKQLPPELRQSAISMMRKAEKLDLLEQSLSEFLLGEIGKAAPAPREGQMSKIVRIASAWAPRGLEIIQAVISQWDQMDGVELEFRRLGEQPVIAIIMNVKPGREVRIADVLIAQPTLVFRGSSKIVVVHSAEGTGETVVSFEPIDGGSAELRYEGIIYGLVRLFAIPLADGRLREVRVFSNPTQQGLQLVNVTMLSEARGDKTDPRRMLVFQDVRRKRIVRDAFSVTSVTESMEQIFNYVTPTRRYTYKRLKAAAAAPAPKLATAIP